jgi:hypothetical protein
VERLSSTAFGAPYPASSIDDAVAGRLRARFDPVLADAVASAA